MRTVYHVVLRTPLDACVVQFQLVQLGQIVQGMWTSYEPDSLHDPLGFLGISVNSEIP